MGRLQAEANDCWWRFQGYPADPPSLLSGDTPLTLHSRISSQRCQHHLLTKNHFPVALAMLHPVCISPGNNAFGHGFHAAMFCYRSPCCLRSGSRGWRCNNCLPSAALFAGMLANSWFNRRSRCTASAVLLSKRRAMAAGSSLMELV